MNDVLTKGFEGNIFIEGAASHFRDLLVNSDPATAPLFEGSDDLRNRYTMQASRYTSKMLFKAIKLCSDCSMNYRTSRNKRLLVELTIIQLSQLAGDDTDEIGGRSPKKLKPIFNKPQNNVQVATLPEKTDKPETQKKAQAATTAAKTEATCNAPAPKIVQGRPKELRSQAATGNMTLGGMFRSTMSKQVQGLKPEPLNTIEQAIHSQSDEQPHKELITNEKLIQAWTAFALQLPENERALSDRMKIMQPVLENENIFYITVDNTLVAEMFEKESNRIIEGIAPELGGTKLRMKINVNTIVVQRHVYDRTKQFEILKKKNPIIGKLRENLNLELS